MIYERAGSQYVRISKRRGSLEDTLLPAHLGFRVLIGQQAHDVRGDEARAARDEDCLRHFTRRACAAACSVVHRECRETLQVRVYKCGKLRVTNSVIKKLHP